MTGAAFAEQAARIAAATAAMARLTPADIAIGETPSDEVFRAGRARLRRYRRASPPALGAVLIVYGLVGRHTITDLAPDRSLVRRLLAAGVDAHVIDWAAPDADDPGGDFDDYVADIDACARHLGAPVLLGVCEGGVLSMIHAALHPGRARGLILTMTPVDFRADGGGAGALGRWARAFSPADVDRLIAAHGAMPGAALGAAFQAISPGRTLAKYLTGLPDAAADPARLRTFLRMEKWLADRPDHPGPAARRWIVELYGENRLAEGWMIVGGRRVDLADIAAPVLNIRGARDAIIPPACSAALGGLVGGGDYTALEVEAGHVGLLVGARAGPETAAAIIDWLTRRIR